jgi:hypothetical protein
MVHGAPHGHVKNFDGIGHDPVEELEWIRSEKRHANAGALFHLGRTFRPHRDALLNCSQRAACGSLRTQQRPCGVTSVTTEIRMLPSCWAIAGVTKLESITTAMVA